MADFYDPISDVQTQWSTTGPNHWSVIDDAIRNPNTPTLTDYVSTNSNNAVDEWGFASVAAPTEAIVVWLYAETGAKSLVVVSLQQNGVERATITIPVNSPKKWYQCKWLDPTGDLSTLTIEVKQVKSGTGAGTYAYIYAAYLRSGPNLDVPVALSGDDGTRGGATLFFPASDSMRCGQMTGNIWHLFARWTGITISGTIDVSYTTVYGSVTSAGSPLCKVKGVDEDNPPAPTTWQEFDADPLTDAGVDWDVVWILAQWYQSGSLNGIFQELVNSYTIADDAVMLQIRDDGSANGNYNECRQWDYWDHSMAAWLHIEFTPAAEGIVKIASEALSIPESLVRRGYSSRLTVEAVGLGEGLVRRLRAVRPAVEAVSLLESSVRRGRVVYQAASAVQLSEASVRLTKSIRIVASVMQITETAVERLRSTRLASESVGVTETVTRRLRSVRQAVSSLAVTEDITRRARSIRQATSPLTITDAVGRRARSVRQVVSTLSVVEAAIRTAGFVKVAASTLSVAEAAVRRLRMVRAVSEPVGIAEAVARRMWSVRQAVSSVSVVDATVRRSRSVRQAVSSLSVTEVAVRAAGIVRIAVSALSLTEVSIRRLRATRQASEVVGVAETGSRRARMVRVINEALRLLEYAINTLLGWQEVVELSSPITRIVELDSGVAQQVGVDSSITTEVELRSDLDA